MGASNRAGSFSVVPTGILGAHFTLSAAEPSPHPLPFLLPPPPPSAPLSGSPPASPHREGLPAGTSHQSHRKLRLSTLLCLKSPEGFIKAPPTELGGRGEVPRNPHESVPSDPDTFWICVWTRISSRADTSSCTCPSCAQHAPSTHARAGSR